MSDHPDTGGQAFPLSYEGPKTFGNPTGRHAEPGMTLRDHFAGQALTGLLQNATTMTALSKSSREEGKTLGAVIAATAYELADVMIQERSE